LVHRDVKPANILLERGVERVMLTDFGLARAVDDATLTRSGLIAGTPHYMSPEQARGEGVDARSDLFSLGSVLYAISTGRPPFRAETTYGILRRVTDDEPRPMRELNPELPAWFDVVVKKLLAKSPDQRFTTSEEVARVFEECLAHVQQPNVFPLPEVARELEPKHVSWRSGRFAMLVGLVVVAAAVAAISNWPESPVIVPEDNGGPAGVVEPQTSSPEIPWDDGVDQSLQELGSEVELLFEQSRHHAPRDEPTAEAVAE
jgi:serine/threonine protein kinase